MGIGGLRFQLELALFRSPDADPAFASPPVAAVRRAAQTPQPDARPAVSAPAPAPPAAPNRGTEPATEARTPAEPPIAVTPVEPATPAVPPAAAPEPTPAARPTPETARPKPAKQPAPQAATPEAGGTPDLDRLASGWAEVVASVGPATRAVINECRPLSVDGNIVTLGFPETKAFLKDVAARKAKELDSAVGMFLGRAVNVRCVATNIELPPAPSADADLVLAEARRIFADDIVEIGEVS
jgi:hypothetical protein